MNSWRLNKDNHKQLLIISVVCRRLNGLFNLQFARELFQCHFDSILLVQIVGVIFFYIEHRIMEHLHVLLAAKLAHNWSFEHLVASAMLVLRTFSDVLIAKKICYNKKSAAILEKGSCYWKHHILIICIQLSHWMFISFHRKYKFQKVMDFSTRFAK